MFSADGFFQTGLSHIDEEHEDLYVKFQKIGYAIARDVSQSYLESSLDSFLTDMGQHFINEENILSKTNMPQLESHQAVHKEILHSISKLKTEIGSNLKDLKTSYNILSETLHQHLLIFDVLINPSNSLRNPSEQEAIKLLTQDKFEAAIHVWRESQGSAGICNLKICSGENIFKSCCAHHFQGKLLTKALIERGNKHFQLSHKLRDWIKQQDSLFNEVDPKDGKLKLPNGLIIGHPTIDSDHQTFIDLINQI
ncbi:MAG: hemerythrin family protein [Magnetovibrio sp.]|nr:hemerythrin family protein [Magnetovibrio sp.]